MNHQEYTLPIHSDSLAFEDSFASMVTVKTGRSTRDSASSTESSSSSNTNNTTTSSSLKRTPPTRKTMKRINGRGIPRVSALYGQARLDEAQEYDDFQEERVEALKRMSAMESDQRQGRQLPTL